jgi:hypothetical protein
MTTGRLVPVSPDLGMGGLETPAPAGPLDAVWLAQIKDERAKLATLGEQAMPPYRQFYKKPDLTVAQVDQMLAEMEKAVGDPEGYYDQITSPAPPVEGLEGFWQVAGCADKIPRYYISKNDALTPAQQAGLAQLRTDFKLGDDILINPNDHKFEFCDPAWWPLLKQGVFSVTWWPKGLAPYIRDDAGHRFIYQDMRNTQKVALMSDFGVGQYHSRFIAKQLEDRAYPYVFHLGDVYYGGTADEFTQNYSTVLDRVMDKSLLFSIPENHELYGGGVAWQAFIRSELNKGRILQDGSYFCVRFPKHQIVAIDVNWNGRQRFTDDASRQWLREVLRTGQDLTTILFTGSAPYEYGKTGTTQLFEDLKEWHELGLFHAWFWGDDHYGALFDRSDTCNFIGSCIGHGGFPGDAQTKGKPSAAPVTWVETATRFPAGYGLRDDLVNNGWVEMSLLPEGGIELEYIDWLGARRLSATYKLDATDPLRRKLKLLFDPPIEFPRPTGPMR